MLISLKEYAIKHGVHQDSVRQKILRGNLEAVKVGRNWCIEEDTPYDDLRKKEYATDKKKIDNIPWMGYDGKEITI